jgi:hypothetical protein
MLTNYDQERLPERGKVRWLSARKDGKPWGEMVPYVNRYAFCGTVKYDHDTYTVCLEWDDQDSVEIEADIFPLVRWAPEDLIKKGESFTLYHGSDAVAEVSVKG